MPINLSDYIPALKYGAVIDAKEDITVVDDLTVNDDLTVTGLATIGETLTVTGATTLSSTLTSRKLGEVVSATNVITAAESGSVFFLNNAAGFVSTLPAVAAGLHFTFIVTIAPTSSALTVVPATGTTIIGQVLTVDVNSTTDPGFTTTGVGTLLFVNNKAAIGDKAEFFCNGTNWFVTVSTSVYDAATLT